MKILNKAVVMMTSLVVLVFAVSANAQPDATSSLIQLLEPIHTVQADFTQNILNKS